MYCYEIMTKNLSTGNKKNTIQGISKIMADNNIGFIPIIENSKVIGIITDRDIIKRAIANGASILENIEKYMTKKVISTYENDDISIAITKMADNQIKRIIITNDQNQMTGIISLKDIAINNQTNIYLKDLFKEISENTKTINPILYKNTISKKI